MSDCFVLYLLLICMKKEKTGAGKFTNNSVSMRITMKRKRLQQSRMDVNRFCFRIFLLIICVIPSVPDFVRMSRI